LLTKYCPGCDKDIAVDEFVRNKGRPDGLGPYCKVCHVGQNDPNSPNLSPKRKRDTLKQRKISARKPNRRFSVAKSQAKKRGHNWDLTLEQWISLVVNKRCTYCSGKIEPTGSGLDRMDNDKGYIFGNVTPCCKICNWIKGPNLSYPEMVAVGKLLKRMRKIPTIPTPPKLSNPPSIAPLPNQLA
jgi:hypothetical protein